MRKTIKRFTLLWVLAVIFAAIAFNSRPQLGTDDGLLAAFLDVGQGDSVLFKTPDGEVILVDTGEEDEYEAKLLPALRSHGVNKIDLLVATHYHSDHIGAAEDIFEDFEVEGLVIPNYEPQNGAKKKLLKLAKAENSEVYQLAKGDSFPTTTEDLGVLVLHPKEGGFSDDENNNSLVLMVKYFDTSILLTGDIEEKAEKALVKEYDLETDILKVAHHGSRTSSCKEFLDEADSVFAVVECGAENSYGHPHYETISALTDDDVRVYRTDLDGCIMFKITERGIGAITTAKN